MPRIGHDRLARFCQRYDVSHRATFEAAIRVVLDDEANPRRRRLAVGVWDVARRIASSDLFIDGQRSQYPKIVIRLDRELHARFLAGCRKHGLTANAGYAVAIMPWPLDTPPEIAAYKATLTPRIVAEARRLDLERRAAQVRGLVPFPVVAH